MSPTSDLARPPELDHPVYWFALLDRALDAGDLESAARSKRELERLGVSVIYRRRSARRKEARHV